MMSPIEGMEKRRWRLEPPPLPPVGKLLISRIPYSHLLKITWPDGQHRSLLFKDDAQLGAFGIAPDKWSVVLNYVWNFYYAYVTVDSSNSRPPAAVRTPPKPPGGEPV